MCTYAKKVVIPASGVPRLRLRVTESAVLGESKLPGTVLFQSTAHGTSAHRVMREFRVEYRVIDRVTGSVRSSAPWSHVHQHVM